MAEKQHLNGPSQPDKILPDELVKMGVSSYRELSSLFDRQVIGEEVQLRTLKNRYSDLEKIFGDDTTLQVMLRAGRSIYQDIRSRYTGEINKQYLIRSLKDDSFDQRIMDLVQVQAVRDRLSQIETQKRRALMTTFVHDDTVHGKSGKHHFVDALEKAIADSTIFTASDQISSSIDLTVEKLKAEHESVRDDIEIFEDSELVRQREKLRAAYTKYEKEIYRDRIPYSPANSTGIIGLSEASIENIMRFTRENRLDLISLARVVHELLGREAFVMAKQLIDASSIVQAQNHPLRYDYDYALRNYGTRERLINGPPPSLIWPDSKDFPHFADTKKPFPVEAFDQRYVAVRARVRSAGESHGKRRGYFAFLRIPGIDRDFYYHSGDIQLQERGKVFIKLVFHKASTKIISRGGDTQRKEFPERIEVEEISQDIPFAQDISPHVLGILTAEDSH